MKGDTRVPSLKGKMLRIVLLCWLLPVLMILTVMAVYLSATMSQQTADGFTEQLEVNLRMCTERVSGAVEASRVLSYDPTIKDAYGLYLRDNSHNYAKLYNTTRTILDRQYRTDNRFRYVVFWYNKSPRAMNASTFNESVGATFDQVRQFWSDDYRAAETMAADLGTDIGFLQRGEQVFLVRNVMDSSFETIGTVVMALNLSYYFDNLNNLTWLSDCTLFLGSNVLVRKGVELPRPEALIREGKNGLHLGSGRESYLTAFRSDRAFDLSVSGQVDLHAILGEVAGYQYLLVGMLVLLAVILAVFFRFFQRQITRPIENLMAGAARVEEGELGYQLENTAASREFRYLNDSFNEMSAELNHQFEHIYEEELALRDARIKALQAHINPHFLNNTLEIINWEARLGGNAKVSKMIESLSTVLDAAIDRDKRPEVRLAEEMTYVSAYLYIISERFGKRLTITQEIAPETEDRMVPRLILQPVIENAVEHGIGPGGKGSVAIRSRLEGERLILEIENDGALTPEDQKHIDELLSPGYDASRETSRNIGISNVNQRLRILYGGESGLTITEAGEKKVIARLVVDGARSEREKAGKR